MSEPVRIYVSRGSVALSLGADGVCGALKAAMSDAGVEAEVIRTGSRGMHWLNLMAHAWVLGRSTRGMSPLSLTRCKMASIVTPNFWDRLRRFLILGPKRASSLPGAARRTRFRIKTILRMRDMRALLKRLRWRHRKSVTKSWIRVCAGAAALAFRLASNGTPSRQARKAIRNISSSMQMKAIAVHLPTA